MDFFLFLLVNGALFIRPAEIVPGLESLELYRLLIIPALLVAFPAVLEQFRIERLAARPVTVCILGLWLAAPLSQLAHGEMEKALLDMLEFSKIVAYYLLFVAVINTPDRLRRFLFWILLFTSATVLLAVLRYHGLVDLPAQTYVLDRREDAFGALQVFRRLCGTGVFRDPNDFSLLIVFGVPLAIYFLTDGVSGLARLLWVPFLGLFGYALALTQSRGGLLAVLVGLAVLFRARFGTRRSLLLLAAVLPVLLFVLAGRQTELLNNGDTAQERFQLWSDGLMFLREAPLFGIGVGEFQVRAGLVAHNSFVHAYAELGLFGGTLFLGAFFFSVWSLYRLRPEKAAVLDPTLRRLQPYVLAVVAGFATALLSLSHVYSVPTYTALGLATAYLGLAAAASPLTLPRFNGVLVQRLAVASIGFLMVTYVLVRTLVHR
jgi:O-antigen ligase